MKKTISKKLFIHKMTTTGPWGLDAPGEIKVEGVDLTRSGSSWNGHLVLLDKVEVEIEYEDRDVTGEVIDAIKRQNDQIMAEARRRVEENNERIANLRCLTHQEGAE